MRDRLVIRTLGTAAMWIGSQPIHELVPLKAQGLFIYLACTRDLYAREVLAEFFWEGRSQAQSLANLRKALSSLRRAAGPALTITRRTVGIDPSSGYTLDADDFEAELAAAEQAAGRDEARLIEHLKAAAALYKGDFLSGFFVDSQAFEDWALLERERLRFRATFALDQLVEQCIQRREYDTAQSYISRLLQIDPLREKTYRQGMRLLAHSGQRESAIAQFQACQRVLEQEMGIAPSAETIALYQRIREGDGLEHSFPQDASGWATRPKMNLPPQATSFVGREAQVSELLGHLEAPGCQLVTIVGPGGIGKTRLALEVARKAAFLFPDGVFFVALASVQTPQAIVPAILAALSLELPEGERDPAAFLLKHLARKALLLVLDNLEHLLGDLGLVRAILSAAPEVKLLVTSRQVLNLSEEWQHPLAGLEVPGSVVSDRADTYSSIRLFVERARHVSRSFSFADDPEGVVRVCQLVEGMPLGIELAAAWLRVLSTDAIANSLFDLEALHEPAEERHRSLRALFENTWQRLSEPEQRALMRLSVFQGGFRVEAAVAVAELTLPLLAALVHKSLLSADFRTGRYDMHQLLAQYARARLSQHPVEEQRSHERHAAFYASFLHARAAPLQDERATDILSEIQEEIGNIRAAWQWAVAQGRMDLALQASKSLSIFIALKGLHHEARAAFSDAITALSQKPPSPERDAQELALQMCHLTPLVVIHGWTSSQVRLACERAYELAEVLGAQHELFTILSLLSTAHGSQDWNKSRGFAEEALALAQRLDLAAVVAAHASLETPLLFTGEFAAALQHTERVLALFDPQRHLSLSTFFGTDLAVIALTHAGYVQFMMGRIEQARRTLNDALERARALDSAAAELFALAWTTLRHDLAREPDRLVATLAAMKAMADKYGYEHWLPLLPGFHGSLALLQGDYQGGIGALLTSLERGEAQGQYHLGPLRRAQLAWAYAATGRLDEGLNETERTLEMIERTGERHHEAEAHRVRGELLLMRGDEAGAASSLERAITVAQHQQARLLELRATTSLARLLLRQGRREEALRPLRAICGWFPRSLDLRDLVEARALLDRLSGVER
jgi:predicted ATPase/DNA-binding SARP family transcriptional activator